MRKAAPCGTVFHLEQLPLVTLDARFLDEGKFVDFTPKLNGKRVKRFRSLIKRRHSRLKPPHESLARKNSSCLEIPFERIEILLQVGSDVCDTGLRTALDLSLSRSASCGIA